MRSYAVYTPNGIVRLFEMARDELRSAIAYPVQPADCSVFERARLERDLALGSIGRRVARAAPERTPVALMQRTMAVTRHAAYAAVAALTARPTAARGDSVPTHWLRQQRARERCAKLEAQLHALPSAMCRPSFHRVGHAARP